MAVSLVEGVLVDATIKGMLKERDTNSLLKLLTSREPSVRAAACYALGAIGDLEKLFKPVAACLKDKEAPVRRQAAEVLGKVGDSRAVEVLVALAQEGTDPVDRCLAVQALAEVCTRLDARAIYFLKVLDPLIVLIKDKNGGVRNAAAIALGNIGISRTIEPLIEALADEEAAVCANAARALGNIGTDLALEPLIVTLKHDDEATRQAVAHALQQIGDKLGV